jgi:hypothetical protein
LIPPDQSFAEFIVTMIIWERQQSFSKPLLIIPVFLAFSKGHLSPLCPVRVPLDFDFHPRTLKTVATTRDNQSEPTAFQRFDSLMRTVISVPKAEIDRREAQWKRERAEKKKSK